ncbi:hypothetical protein QWY28_04670 [Nocardioides sp. SOB77]|uniref:ParA family protein n=1 Tax=Nocardioides oceani TaxID=3058369 RepID=A0ABT8FDH3_9ACTN|nr:hypothetical protein [Nocardioides oceani]MDN4172227.1 hypothetical protein [Nocardioides oceani]
MALIVLASGSGSPGVSTTALGLTLNWHRPALLVDADPTGSSSVFAGFFHGTQEPTGGLINLALSLRDGTLADALPRETLLLDPEAPAERSAWFLPGIRAHDQAPSLLPLWDPLTEQLRALERNGHDVIVDAGRLGLAGWPQPLMTVGEKTRRSGPRHPSGRSCGRRTWPATRGAPPPRSPRPCCWRSRGGAPRGGPRPATSDLRSVGSLLHP